MPAKKDNLIRSNTVKGVRKKTSAYNAWQSMRQRCYNPKNPTYPRYGGRGISVCHRWKTSFGNFVEDMGEPVPGMSLDRIDNDGNYEPGNCRWATQYQQHMNMSTTRWITWEGQTLPLVQWAAYLGIHEETLRGRVKRWPLAKAMQSRKGERTWEPENTEAA